MLSRIRQKFRQNKIIRVAAGACVLALAFVVQYYLAHIPLPIDIEATGKFSPATIKRSQQEELVIEGLAVNLSEGVLLSHEGRANELVNVYLDKARLDETTIEDLSNPNFQPPTTQATIDYTTPESQQTPKAGEQCRTFLKIGSKDKQLPRALHFYQLEADGGARLRYLEIKSSGADLVVEMVTDTPPEIETETYGCRKLLRVGSLPGLSLPPSTQIAAVVAADSAFRFRFQPLAPDAPLWVGGADGFFAPFELGVSTLDLNDPAPFQARTVSIRKLQNNGSNSAPILHARSADGEPLLTVHELKVGSDELQIKVSGKGTMSVNGQAATVDFMERAQKYPIPAAILAALNTALLTWFIRLISSKNESRATQ